MSRATHFWASTGLSPASLLLQPDMQQHLAWIGAVPRRGIRFIRVHYMLDLVGAQPAADGAWSFDWTHLDAALDAVRSTNLVPIFEIMGTPHADLMVFDSDAGCDAWANFVRELVTRYTDRFGRAYVAEWYFETWNEPDKWWPFGDEAFTRYYDACVRGVKGVDPAFRIGGPGTCRGLSDTLKAFLAHCADGSNPIDGSSGVPLDFISVHEKGAQATPEDVTPNAAKLLAAEERARAYIAHRHPSLASVRFMNNECDPQIGWWDVHTWRATAYYPAFMARTIAEHIDWAQANDVSYEILSGDHSFLGAWGQRTLLTRFGLPTEPKAQSEHKTDVAHLGYDSAREHFSYVAKPIFALMCLLSYLGESLEAEVPDSETAAERRVWTIGSTDRDGNRAFIVAASLDSPRKSASITTTLILERVSDAAELFEFAIGDDGSGPFDLWERAGFPAQPDAQLLTRMRTASQPTPRRVSADRLSYDRESGALRLAFAIEAPHVRLVLALTKPDRPPEAPSEVATSVGRGTCAGLAEVLVTWRPLTAVTIRGYRLLTRRGAADRWTAADDTVWLSGAAVVLQAVDTKREYAVVALDFWGRESRPSQTVRA